jgi:hypothetical protein
MKLLKAIKKKLTEHQHGCCHCGGTPTNAAGQGQTKHGKSDQPVRHRAVAGQKPA